MHEVGRKTVFSSLIGSHNYNLATEESDKDYKLFVLPTLEDLYEGTMYSKSTVGAEADYEVHDIRKLSKLLSKSNVNYLEVLFSNETLKGEDSRIISHLDHLFEMRNEIAMMNLPYLFNACQGMFYKNMKLLEKGTSATQHLVEKFGYDTKAAMKSYRIYDFLCRFKCLEFQDFKRAIEYDADGREKMLMIRNGGFRKEDFLRQLNQLAERVENVKGVYQTQPIREDVKQEVEDIVFKIVMGEWKDDKAIRTRSLQMLS